MQDNTRKVGARRNPATRGLPKGSIGLGEEAMDLIGYVEEANPAVMEKMCEMGSLCLEGACPPWI